MITPQNPAQRLLLLALNPRREEQEEECWPDVQRSSSRGKNMNGTAPILHTPIELRYDRLARWPHGVRALGWARCEAWIPGEKIEVMDV